MGPITDQSAGMLQRFKPLPMGALLFQGSDRQFPHAFLLRVLRRGELLFQPTASDQSRKASAGKDQPVIGSKHKWSSHSAQGSVSGGLLKPSLSHLGLDRFRQMQAQKFSSVLVDYQSKGCLAISPGPDSVKIGGPALIRCRGHGGHGLHAGPKPNGALSDLPAAQLEDPLNRVFVKVQTVSDCSIPKRRLLLNHRFDPFLKPLLNLRRTLGGLVINGALRDLKPSAGLSDRHFKPVFFQALFDSSDRYSSLPNREFNCLRARSSSRASSGAYSSYLNCRLDCSLTFKGFARRAFSMHRLPPSTHSLISEGGKLNDRDASTIEVLPLMMFINRAAFLLAVQRLKSSSKITLKRFSFVKYDLSGYPLNQYSFADQESRLTINFAGSKRGSLVLDIDWHESWSVRSAGRKRIVCD